MANSQRGEIDLDIGGKTYTLAMDMNAICELEEVVSSPDRRVRLPEVLKGIQENDFRYTRAFIWAMLRRHHRDVTLLGVSDLMGEAGGMIPFLEKLNALVAFTRPDERDRKELKPSNGSRPFEESPAKAGTGLRSKSRRAKSG